MPLKESPLGIVSIAIDPLDLRSLTGLPPLQERVSSETLKIISTSLPTRLVTDTDDQGGSGGSDPI